MSRVGKNPVILPSDVKVTIDEQWITVSGPRGTVAEKANPLIKIEIKITNDGSVLTFEPVDDSPQGQKMWGTMRALVANMVIGVTRGFEKKLLLVGVGYRAQAQGRKLNLSLGFSHPVVYDLPEGVEAKTPTPTEIYFMGNDKQIVGEVAAKVRRYRKPEPYKGKGIRYAGENVIMKEIKKK